jgi:hypothetical protein
MAYELYVLNQRLPRFPLKEGYVDGPSLQKRVSQSFASWLNEKVVGNLQRRRACSQIFDFSVWMEQNHRVLESLRDSDFVLFLAETKASERCRFSDFLHLARLRFPDLQWEPSEIHPREA